MSKDEALALAAWLNGTLDTHIFSASPIHYPETSGTPPPEAPWEIVVHG